MEYKNDPKVEPVAVKKVEKATAEDVKKTETDLPVSPKAVAQGKGEVPVSASVEEGDETVRRNDAFGTVGPLAQPVTGRMSEGVRQEIEMHGVATDPLTGRLLTKDDLNKNTK